MRVAVTVPREALAAAHYWSEKGNPVYDVDSIEKLLPLLSGGRFTDVFDENPEAQAMVQRIADILAAQNSHKFLPRPKPGHLRLHHSIMRVPATSIIDRILRQGLKAQPGGMGKHSENPNATFFVVADPSDREGGRHSNDAPFVTVDIPLDFEAWGLLGTVGRPDSRPGGVVAFEVDVAPEYIVGVNGIPKRLYQRRVPAFKQGRAALQPNTVMTVYHGTHANQIGHLINGFDANKVVKHHYNAPRHAGLFVAPDPKGAYKFGDVLLEIETAAKHLHGTSWGGTIGRRDPRIDPETRAWLRDQYPESFRPALSLSLDNEHEPQALLRGLVRPSQIKRVRWGGKWYSRKGFLAEHGSSLNLRDLGIDLSYPSLTVPELFAAVEKAHRLPAGKAERIYRDAWKRGGDKIKELLEMSKFGPTAVRSYVRKIDQYFSAAKVACVYLARYRGQRAQAFVFPDGNVTIRLPVSGEITQSDIRVGVRALDQEVQTVLSALMDAGFQARRGGWVLSMESPSFSEQIKVLGQKPGKRLIPYSKQNLDALTEVIESVPGIAVASTSRVASRYLENSDAAR